MTETRFRTHDEVAAVEHDEAGQPAENADVLYGTVTEAGSCSVLARFTTGSRLFLLDSRGRAWADSGRLRLVPVCRCEKPVLGEPVTDPDDLMGRLFCSEDCLTTASEASHGAFR